MRCFPPPGCFAGYFVTTMRRITNTDHSGEGTGVTLSLPRRPPHRPLHSMEDAGPCAAWTWCCHSGSFSWPSPLTFFFDSQFLCFLKSTDFSFSFISSEEKDLASQIFFQINFFYQNNFTYLLFFPAVLYYLFPKTRSGLNGGKALEHTRALSQQEPQTAHHTPYTICLSAESQTSPGR